jgi:hypothetical protein
VIEQRANEFSKISWERARATFGSAAPPAQVWESQFDYNDDDLKRLAATPFREIDPSDLWYYFHDLAYVTLQPDLFDYLFPVCLMDWHQSLLSNRPCSHGDAEFHYGLVRGNVLDKMLTPRQREEVLDFFRDSFLERLDNERGFIRSASKTPAYGWMCRFNSLGLIAPGIERIWTPWWNVETPGRAVSVLQYCSGLIYLGSENPVFDIWTPEHGGGGPPLTGNDSFLFDAGWQLPNVEFLRNTLSFPCILMKVEQAANRLADEPERDLARKIADNAARQRETVEWMIEELPRDLAAGDQ